MLRSHLPDVLIDNRLEVSGEGFGSLTSACPNEYSGDFVSPEQIIPPEGIRDVNGDPVTWESCITMNNHWGHCAEDLDFKPADMLIRKLVECVSKGGNLLLNVGPDARGNIPSESLGILSGIGRWMKLNSRSVYGCGLSGLPKPEYGRVTRRGRTLYFHVYEPQVGYVPLTGIRPADVEKVRLLRTGTELAVARNWITDNYPNVAFVSFGPSPLLPDPVDTVIEVTMKEGTQLPPDA